ncbi:MAG: hypothetical protein JOZ32_20915 [Bryobacterales bacterium]|nr:hypothetical protein [Bryobacterales bacterium]
MPLNYFASALEHECASGMESGELGVASGFAAEVDGTLGAGGCQAVVGPKFTEIRIGSRRGNGTSHAAI